MSYKMNMIEIQYKSTSIYANAYYSHLCFHLHNSDKAHIVCRHLHQEEGEYQGCLQGSDLNTK